MKRLFTLALSVILLASAISTPVYAKHLDSETLTQVLHEETGMAIEEALEAQTEAEPDNNFGPLFTVSNAEMEEFLLNQSDLEEKTIDINNNKLELPNELQVAFEENLTKPKVNTRATTYAIQPGSDFSDAAHGFSNKLVSQGFQTAGQRYHFYTLNVVRGNDYAFLMTNLGVDFDLYVSDGYSLWGMPQDGNVSEEFYMNFDTSATLYVIVDSNNNTDFSNYFLYFGDFIRTGSTTNSEISYNFGTYNPNGLDQYPKPPERYSPNYILDFVSDRKVAGNSLITRIDVDHNTTGTWWGLSQTLILAQDQNNPIDTIANISVMYNTDPNNAKYSAKQQILLRAHVAKCNYMTWNPTVRMEYIYGMNIDNLWWLVYNN